MKFVDEVTIEVIAGNGGNGSASFRRERFIPKGGPDGGDGGRGGSIYAQANRNLNTLIDFRYARLHRAKHGEHGRGSDQYGAGAPDIILQVPVGTMIYDADSEELLVDLKQHGQKALLAAGGEGGLGNLHFKSSTNRAPRQFTYGKTGEQRRLRMELKVLADVGLLGLPNAGKSTLIAKMSNAKPKIADYPFTTLHPNLGVVRTSASRSFVMADIPGLIEGASEGAGLGHRFLRHLARTHILLHLVDVFQLDPEIDPIAQAAKDVEAIAQELRHYDEALYQKPRWLVLNKVDMLDDPAAAQQRLCELLDWQGPVFAISALTGQGIDALGYALQDAVDANKAQLTAQEDANLNRTGEDAFGQNTLGDGTLGGDALGGDPAREGSEHNDAVAQDGSKLGDAQTAMDPTESTKLSGSTDPDSPDYDPRFDPNRQLLDRA